jgi:hypothetical protein
LRTRVAADLRKQNENQRAFSGAIDNAIVSVKSGGDSRQVHAAGREEWRYGNAISTTR